MTEDSLKSTTQPTPSTMGRLLQSDSGERQFNFVAFWVVNAIIFATIFVLLIWCCRYGGRELLNKWASFMTNPTNSDLEYAQRVVRRRQEKEEKKKDNPEIRKQKLTKSFKRQRVMMVVKESDFIKEKPVEADVEAGVNKDDEDQMNSGYIKLRTGGKPRVVPNCCAVCLGPYDVGEKVVWSPNCQHAFHEECVMDWFVKMQKGTPCPCCRQEFTDLEAEEKLRLQRKYKAQQIQFDVNVISI